MRIGRTKLFEQQAKRLTKKYPSLALEIPTALIPLINNQLESFDAMSKVFTKSVCLSLQKVLVNVVVQELLHMSELLMIWHISFQSMIKLTLKMSRMMF